MKKLRHALFALVLLLAQVGALAHAVEHLRLDAADHTADHACTLCLAAHGLDAPLAASPLLPERLAASFVRPVSAAFLSFPAALVSPRARAPPDA